MGIRIRPARAALQPQCLRNLTLQCSGRAVESTISSLRIPPFQRRYSSLRSNATPLEACIATSIDEFREIAFTPQTPAFLKCGNPLIEDLPARTKWFKAVTTAAPDASKYITTSRITEEKFTLDEDYFAQYRDTIVPLELTTPTTSNNESSATSSTTFQHFEAPLSLFLDYIKPTTNKTTTTSSSSSSSLYLAQCSLSTLPQSLQSDIPTPPLLLHLGKGDIYDTNIWLGLSPTYTPLHRDPNPNLFMQLVGQKVVRLLAPRAGRALYDKVREVVERTEAGTGATMGGGAAAFRGEEMMQGLERVVLEDVVWNDDEGTQSRFGIGLGKRDVLFEARLGPGDALFIPLGWWHSIKGVGEGITGSVNWWFR